MISTYLTKIWYFFLNTYKFWKYEYINHLMSSICVCLMWILLIWIIYLAHKRNKKIINILIQHYKWGTGILLLLMILAKPLFSYYSYLANWISSLSVILALFQIKSYLKRKSISWHVSFNKFNYLREPKGHLFFIINDSGKEASNTYIKINLTVFRKISNKKINKTLDTSINNSLLERTFKIFTLGNGKDFISKLLTSDNKISNVNPFSRDLTRTKPVQINTENRIKPAVLNEQLFDTFSTFADKYYNKSSGIYACIINFSDMLSSDKTVTKQLFYNYNQKDSHDSYMFYGITI